MLRVRGRQALRLKIVTAARQANAQYNRFVQTTAQNKLRLTSFRARIVSNETNTSRTSARSRSFKLAKGVRVRRCKIRVRRVPTLFIKDGKTRVAPVGSSFPQKKEHRTKSARAARPSFRTHKASEVSESAGWHPACFTPHPNTLTSPS